MKYTGSALTALLVALGMGVATLGNAGGFGGGGNPGRGDPGYGAGPSGAYGGPT